MVSHDSGRSPTADRAVVRVVHHESESRLQTVLQALSRRHDVPVTDLPPLYDRIDFEAVDALLTHAAAHDTPVTVEFDFEGDRVVVSHDGQVRIFEDYRSH